MVLVAQLNSIWFIMPNQLVFWSVVYVHRWVFTYFVPYTSLIPKSCKFRKCYRYSIVNYSGEKNIRIEENGEVQCTTETVSRFSFRLHERLIDSNDKDDKNYEHISKKYILNRLLSGEFETFVEPIFLPLSLLNSKHFHLFWNMI